MGLPDREVLVFKSMVRLLGHQTHCQWVYLPHSTELRVVADGLPAASTQSPGVQQVLTLGTGNVQRPSYLRLPLHANELEAELNRLGALIAPAMKTSIISPAELMMATPMRMLRWPPATLLQTKTHMRLATLMASKPLTRQELQQRSGENMAVCEAFFAALEHLDLLVPAIKTVPPTLAIMAPAASTPLPTPKKNPIQTGLLRRIRMRLGLGITRGPGEASSA